MAQVTLNEGLWLPNFFQVLDPSFNASTFVIDASGEVAVACIQAPRAGSIKRFEAHIAAVGNTPNNGLRFSLQSINGSGVQDGTILSGTNAFATVASGSVVTGWLNPGNFASATTVTRGQKLALVCDFPSFVASDSVTISAGQLFATLARTFPYGISATNTKSSRFLPVYALVYDDGGGGDVYYPITPGMVGATSGTNVQYNSGSALDEYGLAFTLTFPSTLRGMMTLLGVAAAADYDVVLYDGGSNPSVSFDGDIGSSTGNLWRHIALTDDYTLAANTDYILAIKPTTANNVTLAYWVFNSAGLMRTMGEVDMHMVARVNGGSWTHYDNGTDGYRTPMIALHLGSVDDGTGGGGGGTVYIPQMSGHTGIGRF